MKSTAVLDSRDFMEEVNGQGSAQISARLGSRTEMPKIAYLLKTYPRLSETFILNEILGMEELGARLHILSLRRPDDERFHPAVERVKAKVTYARALGRRSNPLDAMTVVYRHVSLLVRHPKAYIRTVWTYLRRPGHQRMKELMQAGYLAGEIRKAGCTHLHAHFANAPTTVAELIKGFSGIPYSFTAHAKDIYHSSPEELDRKIGGAEFVLTCTAFNRRHLQDLSTSDTPIHCIYHGIDLALFDGRKKNKHAEESPSATPLILSVGRFCEKKGFPYLIRACKLLQDKGVDFRCLIVGYGPMREELDAMIGELDLRGSVSLAGMMTQDQIAELYRHADVFVLPCLVTGDGDRDGIPNVLIEATAQRVPVVSTDVSGIGELVTNMDNGLLVPEKDAAAVADALVGLLRNSELRHRMGEKGREKVLRLFSLETSASAVWGAFQEGLGANNRACESEIQ
jgi:glycosyltransferase involved in cell wall biosynthesis